MTNKEALHIVANPHLKWTCGEVDSALTIVKNALDKQTPMKPVCKEMPYSEEVGFNDEWHCPTCGAYVGYFTEGMNEPEQMEYCNECGQHIARDWSENYE